MTDPVISSVPDIDSHGLPSPPPPAPANPIPEGLAATPEARPTRSSLKDVGESWIVSLQSLYMTIVIAVFVITFICQAFQIPSQSMENTLLIGDYLLVDKLHFGSSNLWGKILPYSDIKRNDIIVFRYPLHPEQHFVKRVIAIPGDRIKLLHGRVWVNGVPRAEPFALYKSHSYESYRDEFPMGAFSSQVEPFWWTQMRGLVHQGELVVPSNQYFAMGDNREESFDSRYWGFVPRANIIGRPLIIYWSVERVNFLPLASQDDKLTRFAYTVTHMFQWTRWQRALRIVR